MKEYFALSQAFTILFRIYKFRLSELELYHGVEWAHECDPILSSLLFGL